MKWLICPYIPDKMPKFPFILKKLIQAPVSAISQSRDRQPMSAFGGKADIGQTHLNVCF